MIRLNSPEVPPAVLAGIWEFPAPAPCETGASCHLEIAAFQHRDQADFTERLGIAFKLGSCDVKSRLYM